MIQLTDLQIVYSLSNNILICLNKESTNKERSIKFDLSKNQYFIEDIGKFLKFSPFDEVSQKEQIQKFYRGWIYRKMSDDILIEALTKFDEISDVKNLNI